MFTQRLNLAGLEKKKKNSKDLLFVWDKEKKHNF